MFAKFIKPFYVLMYTFVVIVVIYVYIIICMLSGNGVDFVSSPKLIRIQPGQEEFNVTIDIIDDNFSEGTESFCLLLQVPAIASEAGVVGGNTTCAEGIILGE